MNCHGRLFPLKGNLCLQSATSQDFPTFHLRHFSCPLRDFYPQGGRFPHLGNFKASEGKYRSQARISPEYVHPCMHTHAREGKGAVQWKTCCRKGSQKAEKIFLFQIIMIIIMISFSFKKFFLFFLLLFFSFSFFIFSFFFKRGVVEERTFLHFFVFSFFFSSFFFFVIFPYFPKGFFSG